ncbi:MULTISPECIES: hypothetical protein [Giesbergeria]|uniref:Uncharacterized protein n=1 Tax=Giesbergeria sinuosa TaxID=80883 RepID=A0ABV9QBS9_9BURK
MMVGIFILGEVPFAAHSTQWSISIMSPMRLAGAAFLSINRDLQEVAA